MTTMNTLSDKELEQLLATARQPEVPHGFAERLQVKLESADATNVVTFPQRNTSGAARRLWLSALPLAASLVFGIWVGANGNLPESLANFTPTLATDAADQLFDIGIEDTESFVNGELS
jgi:hypothetical protein